MTPLLKIEIELVLPFLHGPFNSSEPQWEFYIVLSGKKSGLIKNCPKKYFNFMSYFILHLNIFLINHIFLRLPKS